MFILFFLQSFLSSGKIENNEKNTITEKEVEL